MSGLTNMVTTERTRQFIIILQSGQEISSAEYHRIKDKYSVVLFEVLRFRLLDKNMKYNKNRLSAFVENIINQVFDNIKKDKWSGVRFRDQLKLNIDDLVTERLFKKETFQSLTDKQSDYLAFKKSEIDELNLTEQPAQDLLFHIIKNFVLPDLRQENELYHNVLHLSAINGKKYTEIAAELNINPASISQHLKRAKARFIKLLDEHIKTTPLLDNPAYDKKRLMKILPLLKKR